MYHDLVHWRLAHPWHVVWEDMIANRVFGWIGDIGRKPDKCASSFHRFWVPYTRS